MEKRDRKDDDPKRAPDPKAAESGAKAEPEPASDEHEGDAEAAEEDEGEGEGAAPARTARAIPTEPTPVGDVNELVLQARKAQVEWAAKPIAERIDAMLQLKRRALRQAEELANVVRKETGKPFEEALLADVLPTADVVDYWTDSIEELIEGTTLELGAVMFPGKLGRVHRDPRGVIAVITPWNYPLAIALRTIVPALLCGDAVVFKPSEVTPRSGARLASLFEGLLPEGVLTVVQGGPEVGAALVASPVDLVVFTGGVRAGRAVARSCAERFVPCSLELGGKDAAIVLKDCNLERAARGIVWGAFNNAGQNCASIERVYVEKAIAEAFIQRVVELTKKLQAGRDVAELTTTGQRKVVATQLREAVASGAEILCGGPPSDDSKSTPPTVVRVHDDDAALMRDETFGPVLPIHVVADVDEAIERANDCRYALSTSLWTRRTAWAHGLSPRLRSGVVTINNHGFTPVIAAAPWTGPGETGGGITNSPHALATLTRVRFVLEDRSRARREVWWYPYTPLLRMLVLALIAVRGGAGLFGRIVAFFRLVLGVPKRTFGDD